MECDERLYSGVKRLRQLLCGADGKTMSTILKAKAVGVVMLMVGSTAAAFCFSNWMGFGVIAVWGWSISTAARYIQRETEAKEEDTK